MAAPASPDHIFPLPIPPGRAAAAAAAANARPIPTPPAAAPLPTPPTANPNPRQKPPGRKEKKHVKVGNPAMSPINAKDMEAPSPKKNNGQPHPKPPRRRQRRKCSCCLFWAWAALVLVAIALCIVLAGTFVYIALRPELPGFRIEKAAVSAFDIVNITDFSYLTASIDLFVAVLNKNDDIAFDYEDVKVYLSSDDVNLGRAELAGFSQEPNNLTIQKFHMGVANSLVGEGDGRRLKADFEEKKLLLDVELQGRIRAIVRTFRTNSFSFRVRCLRVDYSRISTGIEGKCEIYSLGWIPLK